MRIGFANPEYAIKGTGYQVFERDGMLYFLKDELSYLYSLDLSNMTWKILEARFDNFRGMNKRTGYSLNMLGDKLLLYGGIDIHQRIRSDLWALDLEKLEWSQLV